MNIKTELENFPSIDLNLLTEKGTEVPDNVRNAIVLYNKALESLQTGSEDIAIIGLKKAVSIYPDFHEAANLLGVCYVYTNDKEKAAEMFAKVSKAESNGLIASNYLKQLNDPAPAEGDRFNGKKLRDSVRKKEPALNKIAGKVLPAPNNIKASKKDTGTLKTENKRVNYWTLAASFLFGVLLTAIVSFIVFQSLDESGPEAPETEQATAVEKLQSKYDTLSNEFEELKKLYEAANNEVDFYRISGRLAEAEKLVNGRQYEQAVDILLQLKGQKLEADDLKKCELLLGRSVPQACQLVYNNGVQLFNKKKYDEAAAKFTKLRTYDSSYRYLNYALYCLGKCYEQLNDKNSALEAFQAVISKYPGTDYAVWSQNKINEINAKQ